MTAHTAGIDLSTDARKTSVCLIDWEPYGATVSFDVDASDEHLIELCRSSGRKVGIDCPFGWPEPFVRAVAGHAAGERWSVPEPEKQRDHRRALAYRTTDLLVKERMRRYPLAVSADRIGKTAMRCAFLLDAIRDVDRSGLTGHVAEVYPAATLHAWGLEDRGLKEAKGAGLRREILDQFAELVTPRLQLCDGVYDEAVRRDDSFDALIAALTARAVSLGKTHRPTSDEQLRLAKIEGWIHVPSEGLPVLL